MQGSSLPPNVQGIVNQLSSSRYVGHAWRGAPHRPSLPGRKVDSALPLNAGGMRLERCFPDRESCTLASLPY
uniref:Uncharacterized protein n=1 Tax=Physcomitrium patens TaxID=3218 RepID=A0A2K1JCG5_PHYPA|nr:hypothetical protein PHYPA_019503 [Physcomitrium patens]